MAFIQFHFFFLLQRRDKLRDVVRETRKNGRLRTTLFAACVSAGNKYFSYVCQRNPNMNYIILALPLMQLQSDFSKLIKTQILLRTLRNKGITIMERDRC